LTVGIQQIRWDLKAAIVQFRFVIINKERILPSIQVENGKGKAVMKFFLRILIKGKGCRHIQPVIVRKPVVVLLAINGYFLAIVGIKADGRRERSARRIIPVHPVFSIIIS